MQVAGGVQVQFSGSMGYQWLALISIYLDLYQLFSILYIPYEILPAIVLFQPLSRFKILLVPLLQLRKTWTEKEKKWRGDIGRSSTIYLASLLSSCVQTTSAFDIAWCLYAGDEILNSMATNADAQHITEKSSRQMLGPTRGLGGEPQAEVSAQPAATIHPEGMFGIIAPVFSMWRWFSSLSPWPQGCLIGVGEAYSSQLRLIGSFRRQAWSG